MPGRDWVVWAIVGGIVLLVALAYLMFGRRGRDILERRALRLALSTKARDVMSHPVVAIHRETTVEDAARTMLERGIGFLPVVGADGELVGIATESDLTGIRARLRLRSEGSGLVGEMVREEGADHAYERAGKAIVGDVMSTRVLTASPDDPISDVVALMMDNELRHLPVVQDDRPVGVVARHDLLALLARLR
ncbi:MAG: CBS domain-containing protein [Actinomycetota bacterium]